MAAGKMGFPAGRISIRFKPAAGRAFRRRLLAVLALSAAPIPALAQTAPEPTPLPEPAPESVPTPTTAPVATPPAPVLPATPPARLEDLIPDSAVANPEAWAVQTDAASGAAQQQAEAPSLDVNAPLAELPEVTLPWPDETELARPEPLEPEPEAALAAESFEQFNRVRRGKEVRLSDNLLLVFPRDEAEFPMHKKFAERFESLSSVESLSDNDDNLAQVAARAREDEDLLQELLRTYGYYDGRVMRSVKGGENGKAGQQPEVRFDIIPGEQYRFGAIALGDLVLAPDHDALRKAYEIWPGDPVLADKIVEENADLDKALGESGYPFAKIGEPDLLIDHDRQEGDLTLPVTHGGKYRFGVINSDAPKFLSSRHLQRIARFKPGEIYRRSDEMDLRSAIVATGLVSTVTITPRETQAPSGTEPGVVDMDIGLTKAPLRTISGAVGYGTGEGFRAEASWEHRNLFPPEGSLRVRGVAGTREQLAGVTFRRNNFLGRDRILTFDTYVTTIKRDAYDARTASITGTYERVSTLLFQKPFTWSAGFEILATDEKAPNATDGRMTYFIGALPLGIGIDTSDSLLDPTKGFRVNARVSPEISVQSKEKSTYIRTQVDMSGYFAIGSKTVLAGRAKVASIVGAPVDNIALSRRIYAGGGGSVRGYSYQGVGPRNAENDPSGGRSLVEFSLEARVKTGMFGGALSVVPFIDAGTVGRDATPSLSGLQFGAGLGVRYNTSFAPIRLDVATPLNRRKGDPPVAVYVGLGQAF